jgi:hypothetical protein
MQAFQFFIEDDRYSVLSLLCVEARTTARARTLAQKHLASAPHAVSIDVDLGEDRLFSVGGVAAKQTETEHDA